jgi:hypothetical protein
MCMAVLMPVVMAVVVMAVMIVMLTGVIVAGTLGLERPRHRADTAALAAGEFGEPRIVRDVDRVRAQLRKHVSLPKMPGQADEPYGVLGADLEKTFRRRLDLDQPPILEHDGVAVVQGGRFVEIECEFDAAMGRERALAALPGRVVEPRRVGDAVRLDGGFADDAGGAQHEVSCSSAGCYHDPVLAIEVQGSCGGFASPFCRSSIEMPSGERMKAMRPSRGGRLMVTPLSMSLRHVA